jgi:hypothetical protein
MITPTQSPPGLAKVRRNFLHEHHARGLDFHRRAHGDPMVNAADH